MSLCIGYFDVPAVKILSKMIYAAIVELRVWLTLNSAYNYFIILVTIFAVKRYRIAH
jgi:hypothetical protein